jgi:hypothetical protein
MKPQSAPGRISGVSVRLRTGQSLPVGNGCGRRGTKKASRSLEKPHAVQVTLIFQHECCRTWHRASSYLSVAGLPWADPSTALDKRRFAIRLYRCEYSTIALPPQHEGRVTPDKTLSRADLPGYLDDVIVRDILAHRNGSRSYREDPR